MRENRVVEGCLGGNCRKKTETTKYSLYEFVVEVCAWL